MTNRARGPRFRAWVAALASALGPLDRSEATYYWPMAEPGWYADPTAPHGRRYWDGQRWMQAGPVRQGPGTGLWVVIALLVVAAVIAAIIVIVVWVVAARRLRVVPTKGQYLMELLYEFIRNSVGRDILGPGFRPYLGLLVGLFTYLLLNNWFGEFFLFILQGFEFSIDIALFGNTFAPIMGFCHES